MQKRKLFSYDPAEHEGSIYKPYFRFGPRSALVLLGVTAILLLAYLFLPGAEDVTAPLLFLSAAWTLTVFIHWRYQDWRYGKHEDGSG